MRRASLIALAVALGWGGELLAQENPLSANTKADYVQIRDYVIRSAEKMPDTSYSFRPAPTVRTFGQIIAHVADDQYNLCSYVKGEKRQAAYRDIETRLSSKTDLIAALRQAFAYCDGVYDAMTDVRAADVVMGRTKLGILYWNTWHTWEHYGNLVVYMRMNGLVPPSSEMRMGSR